MNVRNNNMRVFFVKYISTLLIVLLTVSTYKISAKEFSDHTFIIAEGNNANLNSQRFWRYLENNNNFGIEIKVTELNSNIILSETDAELNTFLDKVLNIVENKESKIIPIFLTFHGNINTLDSIINASNISSRIFFLPQGETWPSMEYLIQSNRRIVLFVNGQFQNESRILHKLNNYIFKISADEILGNTTGFGLQSNVNRELFMIDEFDKLPVILAERINTNLIPNYINYLLENWTRYGKRPNFIFSGPKYSDFNFIISQLNSFTWIKGTVTVLGKTLEKVYWKNQDVAVTNGNFSFPYRGGEELMLAPFAPGYNMTPTQIIITGEMEVPERYSIIASPLEIGDNITASFGFENLIFNSIYPKINFEGANYSFSQDIERGSVIKLPENASVNLGNPEQFGLRNSSFTVSCFVKFTEILEFGDNAILGNFEQEYRKGLHLVLRSGHPYFGLWENDYISETKLQPNIWNHLVWRYILETGEQAIFLNGKNIGSSQGHPPFSGTGNIQLGSALSQGASLRGYVDDLYFWSRPLGNEEINRLTLNEAVTPIDSNKISGFDKNDWMKLILGVVVISLITFLIILLLRKTRNNEKKLVIDLPESDSANQIQLFSEFRAINNDGLDITTLFTPKVKELFLFVLLYTIRNRNGARISDLNEQLWPGIETKKIANNRAVTLNKLRKILVQIEGIEIVIQNQYLVAKMEPSFFCDYVEAIKLCQTSEKIMRQQLETFFALVKKGRLLKGTTWSWLDDIRGLTGNQVIDNLLNLALIYKKENKLEKIDSISKRILDYDDLNEEAIFLQIWVLQKSKNSHLAKFNFKSFCSNYQENMGESFSMNFEQFISHYSNKL